MECNKEEAYRARDVADCKMRCRDFFSARAVVLKAQKLFPELENIPQMLSVCNIHCAAETKVGGEMDWYGILQVPVNADDVAIKKQFRKLALSLHPDKNKSFGAEEAFKLVVEAQRILRDSKLRSEHNAKRNSVSRQSLGIPRQARSRNNISRNSRTNSTVSTKHSSAFHTVQPHATDTYWTSCSFCRANFEYHRTVMNKCIRCQHCLKSFVASEVNAQGNPVNVKVGVQQNCFFVSPNNNAFVNKFQNGCEQGENLSSFNGEVKANVAAAKVNVSAANNSQFSTTAPATEHASRAGMKAAVETEKDGGAENGQPTAKTSKSGSRKRGRKAESESSDSDGGSSSDEDARMGSRDFASCLNDDRNLRPRRSNRDKKQVVYNENESESEKLDENEEDDSDDDYLQSAEKSKLDGHEEETVNRGKGGSLDADGKIVSDEGDFTYPEPEFYDFDQDRRESAVKVNQVWAIYDDCDGFPRFYAHVKKVFESPFKVEFKWLEHQSMPKEDEDDCDYSGLPVACGYFKHGVAGSYDGIAMFSYLVCTTTNNRTVKFRIRPMKGEIWAIFRNRNRDWSSHAEKAKTSELMIVEVLSDFDDNCGARVAYMSKPKGFVSLFRRCSPSSVEIPSNELRRFSHRIPAYRLTGEEGKCAPEGCIELDPAACPTGLAEIK